MHVKEPDGSGFLENRYYAPIMYYLADHDGCMVSELYRDVTGNRSRPDLLDALERAKTIVRVRHGRITRVELTDKGRMICRMLKETEAIMLAPDTEIHS